MSKASDYDVYPSFLIENAKPTTFITSDILVGYSVSVCRIVPKNGEKEGFILVYISYLEEGKDMPISDTYFFKKTEAAIMLEHVRKIQEQYDSREYNVLIFDGSKSDQKELHNTVQKWRQLMSPTSQE